jgi:hypothetical protein
MSVPTYKGTRQVMTNETGIVGTGSGIALSYADDVYLPGQDRDGSLEPFTEAGPHVINYYFPVEIVVVGDISEETHQVIQARIWENLGDALDRVV